MALATFLDLPLPGALGDSFPLQVWCSGGLLAVAAVLGADVLLLGLMRLLVLRPGADSACGPGLLLHPGRRLHPAPADAGAGHPPLRRACCLGLFCCMWGTYDKRQGLRLSCRTAASASVPYLVTLDPNSWNGKDAYAKWSGPAYGFGSQIQEEDGPQRVFRFTVPPAAAGESAVRSPGLGGPGGCRSGSCGAFPPT